MTYTTLTFQDEASLDAVREIINSGRESTEIIKGSLIFECPF